ncbi:thiolase family protein [Candidimonas humi]|uniref:Thiolase family protein n=1 Tax=Candidimonas humi TaxID=683355 RepID=A0ABV8NYA2_9BURK|nr:thiolase family protein [Candidimonas humi]MBV6305595.1 thiolase family protein [Candidimonas humi]
MRRLYSEKQVAIRGVGQSKIYRPAKVSALRLTVDACRAAIADAGLRPADIDGLVSYPGAADNATGFSPVGVHDVRLALALEPTWYGSTALDSAGQMSALFMAIHALVAGTVRNVLVFRTTAEASARARQRSAMAWGGSEDRVYGMWQWASPFGAISPAPWYAMFAMRYEHEYGLTPGQLGAVAVNGRAMASKNPNAIYREPIGLDDYLASRMIASPLRLYDCDVPVDGSTAFVLSRVDDAKSGPNPLLRIEAIGSAFSTGGLRQPTDMTSFGAEAAAAMMWARTELKPRDVHVAQIYDGFSILTLHWIEALGFCGRGEAGSFVEGGRRISLDGELPMNTSGGQLSAGRLHGFGHTYEACLQLWGRCEMRQVEGAKVALACNGAYGLGCMLLVRE